MFFAPALRSRFGSRLAPARAFDRDFDRNFDRFLAEFFGPEWPGADMKQDEKTWTITADLPGVARDQVTVELDGNVVRIRTAEGAPRQYQATYELPDQIDPDASTARLEHGVLTLTLGKKKPSSSARTIAVK